MTEFTSIYDKFLSKIEDYGYAQLTEEDANAHFYKMLESAIARFAYMCRKDLTKEGQTKTGFLETLDLLEQEILATWMVVFYIEGNTLTEDHMRNFLNSRDYRQYSAANLVDTLNETRDSKMKDAQAMMSLYDNQNFVRESGKNNGKR